MPKGGAIKISMQRTLKVISWPFVSHVYSTIAFSSYLYCKNSVYLNWWMHRSIGRSISDKSIDIWEAVFILLTLTIMSITGWAVYVAFALCKNIQMGKLIIEAFLVASILSCHIFFLAPIYLSSAVKISDSTLGFIMSWSILTAALCSYMLLKLRYKSSASTATNIQGTRETTIRLVS